jgi:hypothetical protein
MMLWLGLFIFLAGAAAAIVATIADRRLTLSQSEEYGTTRIVAGIGITIIGLVIVTLYSLWRLSDSLFHFFGEL